MLNILKKPSEQRIHFELEGSKKNGYLHFKQLNVSSIH